MERFCPEPQHRRAENRNTLTSLGADYVFGSRDRIIVFLPRCCESCCVSIVARTARDLVESGRSHRAT